MTPEDLKELERLDKMGMDRVICDIEGQRAAIDTMCHIELVKDGCLMSVTPFSPMMIKDALRAGKKSP